MTTVVIGIGNPMRGDDGVGPAVIEQLRADGVAAALKICREADPAELVDLLDGHDRALIVDAVQAGAAPGTVHRLTADDPRVHGLPAPPSTHGFGLGAALELAEAVGVLPAGTEIYGIEVVDCSQGAALSPAVVAAVATVSEQITANLQQNDTDTEINHA